MSKIEKARRMLGEVVAEKPEHTGQVSRPDGEVWVPTVWVEYTERLEKAIAETMELLEGVEECHHHPTQIRSSEETRMKIIAEDKKAGAKMYGGKRQVG